VGCHDTKGEKKEGQGKKKTAPGGKPRAKRKNGILYPREGEKKKKMGGEFFLFSKKRKKKTKE